MKTIQDALTFGKMLLTQSGFAGARLDCEVLLAHVMAVDRLFLYMQPQYQLSDAEKACFDELISRRKTGEPVAYLVGFKEFFGRRFTVTPDVLIPRPDTEKLIETALSLLSSLQASLSIIDVCTGSGCIAVTLALEKPNARVFATDISHEALRVASRNIKDYRLGDWVSLLQGDLLLPCHKLRNVDLIVANPPYIKASAMPTLMRDVLDFEPHLALLGKGEDGLLHHKQIIESGICLLKEGGHLLLEIGYDQKPVVETWVFDKLSLPRFITDDAGHIRLVCYEKQGAF